METACPECGASLRLNPNLAGTTVSCPRCGTRVEVPHAAAPAPTPRRRRKLELEPDAAPPAPPPAPTASPAPRPRPRYTLSLLGVQAGLVVLGLSCLLGAFFKDGWNPPAWSYFHENPMLLLGAGVALLIAGWTAQRLPVLTTLVVAVGVLGACSWHYVLEGDVDASRVVALALAMVSLFLALQHRRAVA